MDSDLLNHLRKNDIRTISRLISLVENGDRSEDGTLDHLFPYAQESIRIGITGSPGVGKSTILDKFILQLRGDATPKQS